MQTHRIPPLRALIATCLVFVFGPAVSAREDIARIDVNASSATPISLEIVAVSAGGGADWPDGDWRKIVSYFPATDEWASGSLTFKPRQDGRVGVDLCGPWVRLDAATRLLKVVRVDYDDVRVVGASLRNGGFEDVFSNGEIRHWYAVNVSASNPPVSDENRARLVYDGAPEGAQFVRVWHNSRFGQTLEVTAGVPVTITFRYRLVR